MLSLILLRCCQHIEITCSLPPAWTPLIATLARLAKISGSRNIVKKSGDEEHPCWVPRLRWKKSGTSLFVKTAQRDILSIIRFTGSSSVTRLNNVYVLVPVGKRLLCIWPIHPVKQGSHQCNARGAACRDGALLNLRALQWSWTTDPPIMGQLLYLLGCLWTTGYKKRRGFSGIKAGQMFICTKNIRIMFFSVKLSTGSNPNVIVIVLFWNEQCCCNCFYLHAVRWFNHSLWSLEDVKTAQNEIILKTVIVWMQEEKDWRQMNGSISSTWRSSLQHR